MAGGTVKLNNEYQDENEINIDLRKIPGIIKSCWIVMVVAALVTFIALFIFLKLSYVPEYSSTASLYILRQTEDSSSLTYNDFNLATNTVNDCVYILKSDELLQSVIDSTGIDISVKKLKKAVSATNPEDTRFLEVTVTCGDPETAMIAVNAISEECCAVIKETMQVNQASVYSKGKNSGLPSNSVNIKIPIILGIAAAVIVFCIYLAIDVLDDSLETNEEIAEVLEITLLGEIPNVEEAEPGYIKKYKYGRKYGAKYGYGYGYKYGGKTSDKFKEASQKTEAAPKKTGQEISSDDITFSGSPRTAQKTAEAKPVNVRQSAGPRDEMRLDDDALFGEDGGF